MLPPLLAVSSTLPGNDTPGVFVPVAPIGTPLASNARYLFARFAMLGSVRFVLTPSEIGVTSPRALRLLTCWIWMVERSNESLMTSG